MMIHLFHKWGKWEQYDKILPERRVSKGMALAAAVEHRQRRRCVTCGKEKSCYIDTTVLE